MKADNRSKVIDAILAGQGSVLNGRTDADLERFKAVAQGYALLENSIAVLSDMHAGVSYIYYGGFADRLGMRLERRADTVMSVWEDDVLSLVHPDDLPSKYMYELDFFRFVMSRPAARRRDYYMAESLRMKDAAGLYHPVLHRLFYVTDCSGGAIRLALCLYGPLSPGFGGRCAIFNTVSGRVTELASHSPDGLLSGRELQVLRLIADGKPSKTIACELSISINTVSRHRQNILDKLHARNSMEACRMAARLRLI